MGLDRHGEVYQRVVRQMGDDGWMGVGWPKEYGGHGLGEIEQTIFANEAQYADVHLPAVTLQTVGPTLIKYGTEKQKDLFLERILTGDVHFAIGYSEPDAGTDLASLRTIGQEGRRPLRRQRPEAVDHRRPPGRLRLARGPHRPGRAQAQGHLDPDRRHHGPRLLTHADHHRRRFAPRQRDLLQRRPRPRRHAGRRGEPGLEADHHPAQPRAGHARPGRPDRGPARPGRRVGDQGRRRRPRRTCAADRAGDRRVPGQRAAQLGGRPRGRGRRDLGRRRVVVQGVRRRPGAAPARRPDRVVHRYGDPSDEETRPSWSTSTARRSGTWSSPSAAASRRCSAS